MADNLADWQEKAQLRALNGKNVKDLRTQGGENEDKGGNLWSFFRRYGQPLDGPRGKSP